MAENVTPNQKPITNPKLVEAMQKIREDNSTENQNRMLNLAVNAKFLTPAILAPVSKEPDENGKIKTNVKFNLLTNSKGKKYFMAFTDMEQMKSWPDSKDKQPVAMRFEDYAAVLLNGNSEIEGFVINPFSENITFSKQLVANCMAQKNMTINKDGMGVTRNVIDKNTKVKVGNPGTYPIDMVNAINEYLEETKEVNTAYLQLLEREGQPVKSFLFIIEFDSEEDTEVYDNIAKAAKPFLNGMFLEFITNESAFGKQILEKEEVKPFYKKKKFNIFHK